MCEITSRCPRCLSTNIKKNGFTNYLKPCHKCRDCKYKFVDKGQDWFISPDKKIIIKRLLLERISLRGIGGPPLRSGNGYINELVIAVYQIGPPKRKYTVNYPMI